jgi:polyhydroxybutyrate depolymerase
MMWAVVALLGAPACSDDASSSSSQTGAAGAGGGPTSGSGGEPPTAGTPGSAGDGAGAGGLPSGGTGAQAGASSDTGAGAGGAGADAGSAGAGDAGAGGADAGAGGANAGAGGAMGSSGCGQAPPASQRHTIDVSGSMREYILRVPSNYDQNRAYPLIFAWHPLGGSAQQTAGSGDRGYYGLQGASAGAAILVAPEGLVQSGGGGGGVSGRGWWNRNGGDIAFMRAMLERFKSELCIDEDRIFSTGFSFGGMMSYAVGCEGLVRAIAPMAGNSVVSGCTNGSGTAAMMGFHGDDDTVVGISGGRTARDIFVRRNGCSMETMPAQPNWCDGVGQSNQPCTCLSYRGCNDGYPVIWCEFNGPHTPAPNSATTIWSFFSQF